MKVGLFLLPNVTYILELSPKEMEVILHNQYCIFSEYQINKLIIIFNLKICSCLHFWIINTTFILKGYDIIYAIIFCVCFIPLLLCLSSI